MGRQQSFFLILRKTNLTVSNRIQSGSLQRNMMVVDVTHLVKHSMEHQPTTDNSLIMLHLVEHGQMVMQNTKENIHKRIGQA